MLLICGKTIFRFYDVKKMLTCLEAFFVRIKNIYLGLMGEIRSTHPKKSPLQKILIFFKFFKHGEVYKNYMISEAVACFLFHSFCNL